MIKKIIGASIFSILLLLVSCKSLPQQKKTPSQFITSSANTKILPSVYLKRTISKKRVKPGQSFNYLITVRDYSKNAKTPSVRPAKITFPGFKLSKKRRIPKKIRNGRQVSYIYTFVAEKKGRQKIKNWPITVKGGGLSKKVILSSITVDVGTGKISRAKKSQVNRPRFSPPLLETIYEISVITLFFASLGGILYFGVKWGRRFFGGGRYR